MSEAGNRLKCAFKPVKKGRTYRLKKWLNFEYTLDVKNDK